MSPDGFCMKCHRPVIEANWSDDDDYYDSGGYRDKTQAIDMDGEDEFMGDGKTRVVDSDDHGSISSSERTTYGEISAITSGGPQERDPRLMKGPKLIGWLASFSYDPHGRAYTLHEGRNAIGRGEDMEIQIEYDKDISRRHGIITYRDGRLTLTDDHTQNGTKLNETYIDGGVPMEIKDKDKIDIGMTRFTVYLID